MKTIKFSICNGTKSCTIESTGNPNYFKVIIETGSTYKVYRLPAINIQSAMYHAQIDAAGVR